jgi:hypothetical protein
MTEQFTEHAFDMHHVIADTWEFGYILEKDEDGPGEYRLIDGSYYRHEGTPRTFARIDGNRPLHGHAVNIRMTGKVRPMKDPMYEGDQQVRVSIHFLCDCGEGIKEVVSGTITGINSSR